MNREQIAAVVLYHANDVLSSAFPELSPLGHHDIVTAIASRVADALAASAPTWEPVHDVAYERVRRMRVPLGWMYQTEIDQLQAPGAHVPPGARVIGWHRPIFVPDLHDDDGGAECGNH